MTNPSRRIGSPEALDAALAALEDRDSEWRAELTRLEDARQLLLADRPMADRPNWRAGAPTVRVLAPLHPPAEVDLEAASYLLRAHGYQVLPPGSAVNQAIT